MESKPITPKKFVSKDKLYSLYYPINWANEEKKEFANTTFFFEKGTPFTIRVSTQKFKNNRPLEKPQVVQLLNVFSNKKQVKNDKIYPKGDLVIKEFSERAKLNEVPLVMLWWILLKPGKEAKMVSTSFTTPLKTIEHPIIQRNIQIARQMVDSIVIN